MGASGTAGSIDKTFLVAESVADKSPVAVPASAPGRRAHVTATFAPWVTGPMGVLSVSTISKIKRKYI